MINVRDGLQSLLPRKICYDVEERILLEKIRKTRINQLTQTINPDQGEKENKLKEITQSLIDDAIALHEKNKSGFLVKLYNSVEEYVEVNKYILCRLYREADNIHDKNCKFFNNLTILSQFLFSQSVNTMVDYNTWSCNAQKFEVNVDNLSRSEICRSYNIEPNCWEIKSGEKKVSKYYDKFRINQSEFLDNLKYLIKDYTDQEKFNLYLLYNDMEEYLDTNIGCVDNLIEVINIYEDDIHSTIHHSEIYRSIIMERLSELNKNIQFISPLPRAIIEAIENPPEIF